MSLCFRVIPGKLSPLLSGRKSLSKLDRHQLRKHIESSAFFKKFLDAQRAYSITAHTADKTLVPLLGCTIHQNLSLASLDTGNQWNDKLFGKCDENKRFTYCTQTPRSHKLQRLSVVLSKSKEHVANVGIALDNITGWRYKVFETKDIVENVKNNSFIDNIRTFSSESSQVNSNQNTSARRGILFTDNVATLKTGQYDLPQKNENKPSQEQLQSIFDCLSIDLPKLFVKPLRYDIYTNDLIFINNIRGTTSKSLMSYIKLIALLKVIGHMKYAHIKFDIIKITMHNEDDTVKVRWRIRGVTGLKMFITFWKFNVFKIGESIDQHNELWYDGFSTFFVNGDGKIYKHVVDKMMPDQDVIGKQKDLSIAPKLALFTGLANLFDSDKCSSNRTIS